MLSGSVQSWLLALADPEGARRLPFWRLSAKALPTLCTLADKHGVLPAVAMNLRRTIDKRGAARICGRQQAIAEVLRYCDERLLLRNGISLAIRGQLSQLREAMSQRGQDVVVLKGTEFADRLYPAAGLRCFTDLDLLVSRNNLPAAAEVMQSLGYRSCEAAMKYTDGYGQQSWRRKGAVATVEIHWNLVNSPTLRRGLSVELADLQFDDRDGGAARRLSASSLLLIAAVHGATSHGFDRLVLLYDVCQAVRAGGAHLDSDYLKTALARTGCCRAMAMGLDLAERICGEAACGRLRERLSLVRPSLVARMALSRGVVLRAHHRRDSFRRQLFRHTLKGPGADRPQPAEAVNW